MVISGYFLMENVGVLQNYALGCLLQLSVLAPDEQKMALGVIIHQ